MSASILQSEKKCYLSGAVNVPLDKHHIMNGTANRKKSEKYGVWVWLDHDVHMKLHQTAEGQQWQRYLKQEAQRAFEKIWSRELWMKEFKKNYL